VHRTKKLAQKAIKDNERLFSWFKSARGFVSRGLRRIHTKERIHTKGRGF